MNNKNLNCHPERVEGSQPNCCFRSQPPEAKPNQVEPGDPEGSQQNYISLRDIAENAKLNHEIAEELRKYQNNHQLSCQCSTLASRWLRNPYLTWILRSSRSMTRMYVLLSIITLLPTLAHAEQCTPTPDCETLGYTETSCPDNNGVRCPWNTSLWYCDSGKKDVCNNCAIGWLVYSDMTCSKNRIKRPVGVIIDQKIIHDGVKAQCQNIAAALNDVGDSQRESLEPLISNYKAEGVGGWRFPTKEELLAVHANKDAISLGLKTAGGNPFNDYLYWTSSVYAVINGDNVYWSVNPASGSVSYGAGSPGGTSPARPVLAF